MSASETTERKLSPKTAFARIRETGIIGPIVGVLVAAAAAYVIYRISEDLDLYKITAAIRATPWSAIGWSMALTAVSFAAISLYDVIATHRVAPGRASPGLAALAGATGHAIASVVGSDVLVGGPVRYRIYAAAGLDAADVAKIVSINLVTFFLGMAAAVGGALILAPNGILILQRLGVAVDYSLGLALVAAVGAAVVWLWRSEREIPFGGWRLPLPNGVNALFQVAVGAIDIAAAAAALYVLLPADILPGLPAFLVLFIAAFALGTVSHVPAGLGVLEATIIISLGATNRPDVIAGLLVFRVIYFGLPFLLSCAAFAVFEAWRARKGIAGVSASALRLVRPIAPTVLAAFVFIGGAVLVFSSNLPDTGGTLIADVERGLPLPFSEGSHLLASLVGLFLIVLARGLFMRIALARSAAIVLLLCAAVFSLAKGLDWEEAVVLVGIASALAIFGDSFYRRADWRSLRPSPRWLSLVAITLISLTFIGSLAYRGGDADIELWWQFAWQGDASRFVRATFAIAIAASAIALDALINRPVRPHSETSPIPDPVRSILARCPTTQPMVALLGDKRFLVDDAGSAFLMYGISGRSWITMGDPVGDRTAGRELIWRFAEMVDRAGGRPVFYAVASDLLPDYIDLGLTILKVGEEAKVDLTALSLDTAKLRDLRRANHRAERDGLEFAVIPRADVPARIAELRAVSDAWLSTKHAREKGFSLGRFEADYIREFDCAVILKRSEVVAFANIWRGADKYEISPDLMRYRSGVSNVVMETLFVGLMKYGKAQGYQWFNLGSVPFSGLSNRPLASSWNRAGSFVYRHADNFYNFEGLRAFKEKFSPVWKPQYLACHSGLALPRVLLDIASLTAGGTIAIVRR